MTAAGHLLEDVMATYLAETSSNSQCALAAAGTSVAELQDGATVASLSRLSVRAHKGILSIAPKMVAIRIFNSVQEFPTWPRCQFRWVWSVPSDCPRHGDFRSGKPPESVLITLTPRTPRRLPSRVIAWGRAAIPT